jgi:CBS domain containing-hemolysin-like protein
MQQSTMLMILSPSIRKSMLQKNTSQHHKTSNHGVIHSQDSTVSLKKNTLDVSIFLNGQCFLSLLKSVGNTSKVQSVFLLGTNLSRFLFLIESGLTILDLVFPILQFRKITVRNAYAFDLRN